MSFNHPENNQKNLLIKTWEDGFNHFRITDQLHWVWSQASPCGIYGVQSDIGPGFCLTYSVIPWLSFHQCSTLVPLSPAL